MEAKIQRYKEDVLTSMLVEQAPVHDFRDMTV
jgi:hypothetical protein